MLRYFFCLRFRSDTFKLNVPQLFFSYALVGNNGNKQTFIAPECFSLAFLLWHGLTPVAGKATVMWGGLCALISVLGDYLFFWATDSLFVSCCCDHELLQNVLIVPCVGKISWLFFIISSSYESTMWRSSVFKTRDFPFVRCRQTILD